MRVYSYEEAQEAALKMAGNQKKTAYIFENLDGDIFQVVYKNDEKWGDYQLNGRHKNELHIHKQQHTHYGIF